MSTSTVVRGRFPGLVANYQRYVGMAGRSLDEVAPIICLRVQETLEVPTTGREVRVQRWRRNAPAVSMGAIQC